MAREAASGLAEAYALMDAVPTQAQKELVVELGLIGRDVLKVQEQLVPVRTGALRDALSLAVLVDQLRVRIGLINARLAPFYGRIVEFGRKAQVVRAHRRSAGGRKSRRSDDLAGFYSLRVGALAPHPYVNPTSPDLDTIATARLANYWSNVMQNAGAT